MLWPSTVGMGFRFFMLMPITPRMVLMALTPAAPPRMAAAAGKVMSVMFGVILAQTGMSTASTTQRVTSSTWSGSWPMAAPMPFSGWPWGQEKFSSRASQPASALRAETSCQRPFS